MISSLVVRRVRVPFRIPFATAAGTWAARDAWILRLAAADGRSGVGEAVLEDEAAAARFERLAADAAAMAAAGGLPEARMLLAAGDPGRALTAAIEAARLDLERSPLALVLPGGAGVGVNAVIGASGGPEAVEAAVEAARAAVAAGFRTLKLKAGAAETTSALAARIGAVREAVGPHVALRLDVNASWDLEAAVERLAALESVGLQYVEQPMPGPMAGLRRLARVPVAADEAVTDVAAARALLADGGADVLVVKPARVGGPAAVTEIAALAAAGGVPVVISTLFETGVGLALALACAAALPDVPGWPAAGRDHGLATADLLESDLLVAPLAVVRGRMHVPGGPGSGGLGIVVDGAAVERYGVTA